MVRARDQPGLHTAPKGSAASANFGWLQWNDQAEDGTFGASTVLVDSTIYDEAAIVAWADALVPSRS